MMISVKLLIIGKCQVPYTYFIRLKFENKSVCRTEKRGVGIEVEIFINDTRDSR